MPRILVTGSKGLVGSRTVSYLQEKGYSVVGIDEDIRDVEALRPYFKDVEFVIHAAAKKYNPIKQEDFYIINVLGTKNVVELCLENGSKLIHFSSTATTEAYGVSKQESQKLVEEYCFYKGLKAVVLRLCVIYDKDNHSRRRGTRYPLENLVVDIENIIKAHDFNKYELLDYEKIKT